MFGSGTQYVAQADLELSQPLWLCLHPAVPSLQKISRNKRASEWVSLLLRQDLVVQADLKLTV